MNQKRNQKIQIQSIHKDLQIHRGMIEENDVFQRKEGPQSQTRKKKSENNLLELFSFFIENGGKRERGEESGGEGEILLICPL